MLSIFYSKKANFALVFNIKHKQLHHLLMKHLIIKSVLVLCAFTFIFSCKKEQAETEQTTKVYTDAEISAESKKVNDFFQKVP